MTATPYTVEEARERARTDDLRRCYRTAATLRKYAQMCEAIAEIERETNGALTLQGDPCRCGQSACQIVNAIRDIIGKLNAEE